MVIPAQQVTTVPEHLQAVQDLPEQMVIPAQQVTTVPEHLQAVQEEQEQMVILALQVIMEQGRPLVTQVILDQRLTRKTRKHQLQ